MAVCRRLQLQVHGGGLQQGIPYILQPEDPCARPHQGEALRVRGERL